MPTREEIEAYENLTGESWEDDDDSPVEPPQTPPLALAQEVLDKKKEKKKAQTIPVVPKKSWRNFRDACKELGWEWSLNELSHAICISEDGGAPRIPDAEYDAYLREEFSDSVYWQPLGENKEPKPWRLSESAWRGYVRAVSHKNRVNPFKDYIESCEVSSDPNAPDLDRLFVDGLGAEDIELYHETARLFLSAAVRRACIEERSVKFDLVPVMIGPQGTAKTEFLKFLFPNEIRYDLVTDAVSLFGSDVEFYRSIAGRVVCVADELIGADGRSIQRVKARITRYEDQYRQLYYDKETPRPRKCIIAATANDLGEGVLPPDPSGYRRWVPILVPPAPEHDLDLPYKRAKKWLGKWRDHLWALALEEAEKMNPLILPQSVRYQQEMMSEKNAYENNVLYRDWIRGTLIPMVIERRDEFLANYSKRHTSTVSENKIEEMEASFQIYTGGATPMGSFVIEDEFYDVSDFGKKKKYDYIPANQNALSRGLIKEGFKKKHMRTGNLWYLTAKGEEAHNERMKTAGNTDSRTGFDVSGSVVPIAGAASQEAGF